MRASLLPLVTQDDVEQLVEPILHRYEDLTLVGRHLVVKPVGHVLRFIRFGNWIFDDLFNVTAVVDVTFLRYSSWATYGGRALYDNGWGSWNIYDPEEVERLRHIIEETTLPELRRVNTIDDYVAYRLDEPKPYNTFSFDTTVMAHIAITKGDFDEALSIVDAAIAKGWVDHLPTYYELLKKRDRGGLITFLRKQQARSIATLGLTDYWKPTPFPLEL
ncbi:hypothetical protein J2X72_001781 [Phyllobacterium sp. 1468]|uniref:hypothetical protein n=1 Tax=Phyllobacterium sp. 1468 TaxID=2817759 RepID=UPI0028573BA1|nr:hypothetical protein [Phyllobacterium sp. 1468]MDR6632997.1 hypothetical protein [Phyllobacterium sp. 1468]